MNPEITARAEAQHRQEFLRQQKLLGDQAGQGQRSNEGPAAENGPEEQRADAASTAPAIPPYQDRDEVDSALGSAGSSYMSSTTSLSPSIYEYVSEYGRTYHSYKSGQYDLPNDEKEQDRLDLQHAMCTDLLGGRLALAPVDEIPLHNVLDLGTGTGVWAIDFADSHPQASVLGTDLSPIQPKHVPPNCAFVVDDAEDEWLFKQPFSYIHARAIITCFKDPRAVVRSAFAALQPGGLIEFQDPQVPFVFMDPQPPPDSPFVRWQTLVMDAAARAGRPWVNCANWKPWFEEAGFVDVHVERFFAPAGPWKQDDKRLKRIGAVQLQNLLDIVEAVTPRALSKLGWEIEEMKVFIAQVRAEFMSGKLKAWCYFTVTWGRKPGVFVPPDADGAAADGADHSAAARSDAGPAAAEAHVAAREQGTGVGADARIGTAGTAAESGS